MFGALHCMARDLDTNKIGAEVFKELWDVGLEENGEDKMVGESNQWRNYLTYKREEDASK